MKFITTFLIIIILFVTEQLTAQHHNITATVVNATSDAGTVSYALYDKENFRVKPIQTKNAIIKEGKSKVVFTHIPKGVYVVLCFHDKNSNHKMDFQPNGMPIEDYGISTNNINRFGPPTFEDGKFTVDDNDVSLEIKF